MSQTQKFFRTIVVVAAVSGLLSSSAIAQSTSRINISSGGLKTVKGSVKGKQYLDYLVRVRAGQSVTVSLSSRSSAVFFNFNPPKSNLSLFNGSFGESKMESRVIPSDGDYIVRVYQMGAAASDGKTNTFQFSVKIDGKALKPTSGAWDAKLKGTPYHAMGPVSCSVSIDPKRKTCDAYVIRRGANNATIEFRIGTLVRRVLFKNGSPIAHDSAEAFTFSKAEDMTTVRFGDGPSESYTVSDALLFGG